MEERPDWNSALAYVDMEAFVCNIVKSDSHVAVSPESFQHKRVFYALFLHQVKLKE